MNIGKDACIRIAVILVSEIGKEKAREILNRILQEINLNRAQTKTFNDINHFVTIVKGE